MQEVIACGYIGMAHPDLDEWRRFATLIGLQIAPESTENKLFLRMDERAYRICIERGTSTAHNLVHVGWEVADSTALDRLATRLRDAGVDIREDPQCAGERCVDRLFHCVDPQGNRLEFFIGARACRDPFVSPTAVRFVTSDVEAGNLGMGHLVACFDDFGRAWHFYADLLGFKFTEANVIDGTRWMFMRVNPRHHSLAFAGYASPTSYHHFLLEVADLDMVGYTFDRLMKAEASFVTGIGKHVGDEMLSFYVRTPSGIELEYGCGGKLVRDDSWISLTQYGSSFWGHHPMR